MTTRSRGDDPAGHATCSTLLPGQVARPDPARRRPGQGRRRHRPHDRRRRDARPRRRDRLRQVDRGPLDPAAGQARPAARSSSTARTSPSSPARQLVPVRRKTQMIFQDPYNALNPRHTVGAIISAPFEVQGVKPQGGVKAAVQDLMERVGLNPEHYNRYPNEFSGGQRQRIGIARAVALRPKLIVCDEPVSALDVSIQAQIINLLDDLQDEFGIAYLFVAHDLSVVRQISDRVAVMYLGHIVEMAPRKTHLHAAAAPVHPLAALGGARPGPGASAAARRASCSRATCPARSTRRPAACSTRAASRRQERVLPIEVPPLSSVGPDHEVACHFAEESRPAAGQRRRRRPRRRGGRRTRPVTAASRSRTVALRDPRRRPGGPSPRVLLRARADRSGSPSPRSRPRLGRARRRTSRATTSCSTRRASAGADLVVFPELGPDRLPAPGPRRRGRDAARRPAPGRAGRGDARACRPSSRSSRSRPTTGCSSRPRCSRTARSGTSTASSSCRPTACSTSGGSSPPATCCGRCRRGSGVGPRDRRSARTSGTWPCRSCWPSTAPRSSSTSRRRRAATSPPPTRSASGTATSWRTLMRTYAQLTTSFVVFCNRVGVDESISFWGGSEVIAPTGAAVFSAPLYDEGLFTRRHRPRPTSAASGSALPLLRDERPELQVRELARIVAERAGLAPDSTADPAPSRASTWPRRAGRDPIGFGDARRARPPRPIAARTDDRRGRAGAGDAEPPFELPDELAIDTDVARRVIGEFIRGQLRAGRLRAGGPRPVGRHRLGARRVPRGRGDRRRAAAVRADAVPHVVAGVARPTPRRSSPPSAARASSSTSARWSTATSTTRRRRGRERRCGAATSWPGCGWPCCTTSR